MKEIPILFNGEMVRAILEGRKTQTRRPVNPQPPKNTDYVIAGEDGRRALCISDLENGEFTGNVSPWRKCPYGQPGDILWVRETWQVFEMDEGGECYGPAETIPKSRPHHASLAWAADPITGGIEGPWRPSIHMPRWAARIFLRVKSVRIQRVQDITEEDAVAEGFEGFDDDVTGGKSAYTKFAECWNGAYGTFSANPWVWAIEFERVEAPAP